MVPQLKVQDTLIDLAPEQFYDYWIGMAYSTCSLGGVVAGFLDPRSHGKSVLELHASFLIENIPRIEDHEVNDLFVELLEHFNHVISLDNVAFERLSVELHLPRPSTTAEWRQFYKKFEKALHQRDAQSYLEDPALRDLLPSLVESASAMRSTKLRIVSRILTLFPALSESKYIDPRDREMLNLGSD